MHPFPLLILSYAFFFFSFSFSFVALRRGWFVGQNGTKREICVVRGCFLIGETEKMKKDAKDRREERGEKELMRERIRTRDTIRLLLYSGGQENGAVFVFCFLRGAEEECETSERSTNTNPAAANNNQQLGGSHARP